MKPQKTLVVISFDQLVSAEIPHHHRATAILASRDDAFEVEIIDWMILSRHGESALILLERWTFRNGPRLKHVVHLETKVVMQMTRSMFLNNKPAPASLPAATCRHGFRLRGLLEISFLRIQR